MPISSHWSVPPWTETQPRVTRLPPRSAGKRSKGSWPSVTVPMKSSPTRTLTLRGISVVEIVCTTEIPLNVKVRVGELFIGTVTLGHDPLDLFPALRGGSLVTLGCVSVHGGTLQWEEMGI